MRRALENAIIWWGFLTVKQACDELAAIGESKEWPRVCGYWYGEEMYFLFLLWETNYCPIFTDGFDEVTIWERRGTASKRALNFFIRRKDWKKAKRKYISLFKYAARFKNEGK